MATAARELKLRPMHVVPGYPSLSDEARGVLKFLWRKSHVKDDWTKGGEISDAWDRWSIFPWYMYPRYDLEWVDARGR